MWCLIELGFYQVYRRSTLRRFFNILAQALSLCGLLDESINLVSILCSLMIITLRDSISSQRPCVYSLQADDGLSQIL